MTPRREPGNTEMVARLLLLNKPYGTLSQFSRDASGKPTLEALVSTPSVYPAGRLDADSEGLLALTDDGALQARLSQPQRKLPKVYWVQVEGAANAHQLEQLRRGVLLNDGPTLPAEVEKVEEPKWLWPRVPPVRARAGTSTSWLTLSLREGRNRQIRRMTAAVGIPTLRLIRTKIGPLELGTLLPGELRTVDLSALKGRLKW
jgi:23S rRNA pseudouridine2457 synthase